MRYWFAILTNSIQSLSVDGPLLKQELRLDVFSRNFISLGLVPTHIPSKSLKVVGRPCGHTK